MHERIHEHACFSVGRRVWKSRRRRKTPLGGIGWPFSLSKRPAEDKKSGKSAYDDVSEKKKKSDSDPTYSENMKLSIKIMERARMGILKLQSLCEMILI